MKKRIVYELLKLHQNNLIKKQSSYLYKLHQIAYNLISDMIIDIKRPFKNICIHGRYPQIILPVIYQHNKHFKIQQKDIKITLIDHIRRQQLQKLYNIGGVKQIRYLDNSDSWIYQEQQYDLLLTSLKTHHTNQQSQLLRKYQKSLKPDGALIGSTLVQGTLSQLYWSYLMAENQRYGGMSPKVMQLTSLGQLGSSLTTAKYQLITIVSHQYILQLDSVVDLITLLQQLGESGYLKGRRKGVYKDLLLAASAMYQTQFGYNNCVKATLALSKFIAWKKHESQPKPLSRGHNVGSIQFVDQLKKYGDQVQNYLIQQGVEEPKRIK